jgi:hypothetical protein
VSEEKVTLTANVPHKIDLGSVDNKLKAKAAAEAERICLEAMQKFVALLRPQGECVITFYHNGVKTQKSISATWFMHQLKDQAVEAQTAYLYDKMSAEFIEKVEAVHNYLGDEGHV